MSSLEVKVLEIRDEGTFIPVVCVNMNSSNAAAAYYLRCAGYPNDDRPNIMVTSISADGGPAWNDPYGWGGRTYPVAHNHIIDNWHTLTDGDVIDVQFILEETTTKKTSERFHNG